MAAPAWRAYTTAAKSVTTTWSANKPTGTADGDFLLAAIVHGTSDAFASYPAGWNMLYTGTYSTHRLTLLWKIAASEGASWTWTMAATATGGIQIHAFSGVDTNHPIGDRTGNALTSATLTSVAGTALVAEERMVCVFASRTSAAGSMTTSSGATEHSDNAYSTSRLLSVQSIALTNPGSTGTMSVTVTNYATADYAYMLCLRATKPAAPVIEKVHVNAVSTTTNSNTVTYGYAIPADRVLLAICTYEHGSLDMSTPSGWTLVYVSGFSPRYAAFWRFANGSDTQQTFNFPANGTTSACMVIEISGSNGYMAAGSITLGSAVDNINCVGVAGVLANEIAIAIGHAAPSSTTQDMKGWPIGGEFEPIKDGWVEVAGVSKERTISASVSYRTGDQATAYTYWRSTATNVVGQQYRFGYSGRNSLTQLFFGINA
jgi:hypothetical protein